MVERTLDVHCLLVVRRSLTKAQHLAHGMTPPRSKRLFSPTRTVVLLGNAHAVLATLFL
jgi:hypothetical protein